MYVHSIDLCNHFYTCTGTQARDSIISITYTPLVGDHHRQPRCVGSGPGMLVVPGRPAPGLIPPGGRANWMDLGWIGPVEPTYQGGPIRPLAPAGLAGTADWLGSGEWENGSRTKGPQVEVGTVLASVPPRTVPTDSLYFTSFRYGRVMFRYGELFSAGNTPLSR